jgi:hypothetical protein
MNSPALSIQRETPPQNRPFPPHARFCAYSSQSMIPGHARRVSFFARRHLKRTCDTPGKNRTITDGRSTPQRRFSDPAHATQRGTGRKNAGGRETKERVHCGPARAPSFSKRGGRIPLPREAGTTPGRRRPQRPPRPQRHSRRRSAQATERRYCSMISFSFSSRI